MSHPSPVSDRRSLRRQRYSQSTARPARTSGQSRTVTTRRRPIAAPYPNPSAQPSAAPPSPQPKLSKAALIARYKGIFTNKATWTGISAIALSMLAVVPFSAGSESTDVSSCQQKIKPTGNISRGQLSALLALPAGASKEAVQNVTGEPYCTLPALSKADAEKAEDISAIAGNSREAYPLAFDPDAWVVIAYTETEEYLGYDFVFKP